MADQPHEPDPLGDRLRATLKAEQADIERRAEARAGSVAAPQRNTRWVPLLAAAALLVVGGVLVALNQSNDTTVDLGVAASDLAPTAAAQPVTPTPDTAIDPAAEPTASIAPDPTTTPPPPTSPPVAPAPNECGDLIVSGPHFVWDIEPDDLDGGLIAHRVAGVDAPVTRILVHDEMVVATGGCTRTTNGAAWFELLSPSGTDWVNSRYLQTGIASCLVGEQYGTRTRNNASIVVGVKAGDVLGAIAERHNVALADLLAANPQLIPDQLTPGDLLRIPTRAPAQAFGPIDGLAIFDNGLVAFAEDGADHFRWYVETAVIGDAECFGSAPTGHVCLTGPIRLIDQQEPEPVWTGDGPVTALRTGRIRPALQPRGDDLVEVGILEGDQEFLGLIDPAETAISAGPCVTSGSDELTTLPCARQPGMARPPGSDPTLRPAISAGDTSSDADHVHDLRTESNAECTRIVIEFGADANEDDRAAAILPPVRVDDGLTAIKITTTDRPLESAFGDPQRIDYPNGIGLFTLEPGYEFSVQLMHSVMEPHIRFMNDPARVVIDLFEESPASQPMGAPFGERFVLRHPVQQDDGPGIPVGADIMVTGFGRPFEAFGMYRIWSVQNGVDPSAFLLDPPPAAIEGPLPTSGWAEAWGEFAVQLPPLEPGTYIAVFGELPPTDEIGFYGTGQLFRISEPDDPVVGDYPPPVLLPDVELPPEFDQ